MTTSLDLPSGPFTLSARLHAPTPPLRGAVVVTHPHPAHGGAMDHPVVGAAVERAARLGLLALCFDFRGVGQSEGAVEDRAGHRTDVEAAACFLRTRAGEGPLLGAGFSYGARLLAEVVDPRSAHPSSLDGLLLLAPPTKVPASPRDYGNLLLGRPLTSAATDPSYLAVLGRIPVPVRALVGDRDVVSVADDLAAALPPQARLDVLAGLSHFFSRAPGAGPLDEATVVPALDHAYARLLEQAASARPRGQNSSSVVRMRSQ